MPRNIRITLRLGPGFGKGLLAAALLIVACELGSETLNLVATYPAASGVYNQIVTVGNGGANTVLARSAGNVGIGTSNPSQKLEVNGHIALSGTAPTFKIINSALPTDDYDLANKAYVDAQIAGSGACYVSYRRDGSCLAGFSNRGSLGNWGSCNSTLFHPPGTDCGPTMAANDLGPAFLCCK